MGHDMMVYTTPRGRRTVSGRRGELASFTRRTQQVFNSCEDKLIMHTKRQRQRIYLWTLV